MNALSLQQLLAAGAVWTVADDAGPPAAPTDDGLPAVLFWSSPSRAARAQRTVPRLAALPVVRLPLAQFRAQWLPGLERDGLLVGLDWSALGGAGLTPAEVEAAVGAAAGAAAASRTVGP